MLQEHHDALGTNWVDLATTAQQVNSTAVTSTTMTVDKPVEQSTITTTTTVEKPLNQTEI